MKGGRIPAPSSGTCGHPALPAPGWWLVFLHSFRLVLSKDIFGTFMSSKNGLEFLEYENPVHDYSFWNEIVHEKNIDAGLPNSWTDSNTLRVNVLDTTPLRVKMEPQEYSNTGVGAIGIFCLHILSEFITVFISSNRLRDLLGVL